MKKKFVSESLEDFYGKGYTSTSTRRRFDDDEDYDEPIDHEVGHDEYLRKSGQMKSFDVPLSRRDQHERTRDWERRHGGDTPADQGARAARKEEAPERKDPDAAFYKGGYGEKRARPGYKQYHVLKALSKAPKGLRYSDIIKIAYELSHGKGTFDPKEHRGYWSAPFVAKSEGDTRFWHHPPQGWMTKYADYLDKKYHINDYGREKLKELEKKWG